MTVTGTGYLEARRIRDSLVQAFPDSRNIFGRVSGPAVSCIAALYTLSPLYIHDLFELYD